ncbi:MAG TPA: hypothetical protein VF264_06240, partial [Rhodanobacteraceae bacterium]
MPLLLATQRFRAPAAPSDFLLRQKVTKDRCACTPVLPTSCRQNYPWCSPDVGRAEEIPSNRPKSSFVRLRRASDFLSRQKVTKERCAHMPVSPTSCRRNCPWCSPDDGRAE